VATTNATECLLNTQIKDGITGILNIKMKEYETVDKKKIKRYN